jgi:hypothetical protein
MGTLAYSLNPKTLNPKPKPHTLAYRGPRIKALGESSSSGGGDGDSGDEGLEDDLGSDDDGEAGGAPGGRSGARRGAKSHGEPGELPPSDSEGSYDEVKGLGFSRVAKEAL